MSRINRSGFSLIELCVVIVIAGILSGIAMQSMTAVVHSTRESATQREMQQIAHAITGDPEITINGVRSDFGFVGDAGIFPVSLSHLSTNPGNLPTWDGPYLQPNMNQDTTSWMLDGWGSSYTYLAGSSLTSTGGGTTRTTTLADNAADYLRNTIFGTLRDAGGAVPGATNKDSVRLLIDIPAGTSGMITKQYTVDSAGNFRFDSIPVGSRRVRAIYLPTNDTLTSYLTVLPRHRSTNTMSLLLATVPFGGTIGASGCVSGSVTLRPIDNGASNQITDTTGCDENWDCVDESVADNDATRLTVPNNSWKTELYEFEDPPVLSCSVASVSVYVVARRDHTQGQVRGVVRVGGTSYTATTSNLTTSYQTYTYSWSTSPATGNAWTWAEVNLLQAGYDLKGQSGTHKAHATQCYVEVSYQP